MLRCRLWKRDKDRIFIITKDELANLHIPIAYFTGGTTDIAHPNASDDNGEESKRNTNDGSADGMHDDSRSQNAVLVLAGRLDKSLERFKFSSLYVVFCVCGGEGLKTGEIVDGHFLRI